MKTSATNRKLRLLLTAIGNGSLLPRPEFQRRLVWSNKHKSAFIDTVLKGLPFPEIYIAAGEVDAETGEGIEMLVDGQQRITTLYQYFKKAEDLTLGRNIVPYSQLSEDEKLSFLEYEVVIRDLGKLEIEQIIEVFERINSTSYSLNAMEIHNARYDGIFKQFGEIIARSRFFSYQNFFSSNDVRRMQDVRFCLNLTITLMLSYFNRDEELEDYLEKYNEIFPEEEQWFSKINDTFHFVGDCDFEKSSRVWKKADMFTLLVEYHRYKHKKDMYVDIIELADSLKEFYEEVDQFGEGKSTSVLHGAYYKASLQATNDRGNRILRGEIVQSVLDPSYEPNLKSPGAILEEDINTIKEKMIGWFQSKYEDPVHHCPYESKEGGYEFIYGGPFDAREELEYEFSDQYPDSLIDEVASELEGECLMWSGIPSKEWGE